MGKSKKMKFFKTAQNATQYDFLVFLDHFMVIFYGFRSEFACLRTIFTLFGSKNVENYLWLSKRERKRGSSEQKKIEKNEIFKTAQNAVQYDFLVFLSYFMVISYGFRSEFACLRTIFTLFGSKNVENYLWLSKMGAKNRIIRAKKNRKK